MRTKQAPAAALAVALAFGATAADAANLVETAEQRGRFDTLVRALEAAGMAGTLADDDGPFTLFAPTDEAFAALPEGFLDGLLAGDDPERLRALLGHHVVVGRSYPSNRLPVELAPIAGGPLLVDFEQGGLTLRSVTEAREETVPDPDALSARRARVVIGDIAADNGVIHAIDTVLVPPDLAPPEAPAEAPPVAAVEPAEPEVTVVEPREPTAGGLPAEEEPVAEAPQPEATVERVEPEPGAEPAEPEAAAVEPEPRITVVEPEVTVVEPEPEATAALPEPEAEPSELELAIERVEPPAEVARPAEPEDEEPAAAIEPAAAAAAAGLTSFEELIGRTVRSQQGEETGEVADIIFSKATGEIELVVVDFGGFLGLWEKPVAVPWREVRFDSDDAALIVEMTQAEIEAATAFDYDALDAAVHEAYVGPKPPAG